MKTGITIYSVGRLIKEGKMDVSGFIEYAGKLGFEGVDLGYSWKDEAAEAAMAPRWAAENGIKIAGHIVGNNFLQATEEKRRNQVDIVRHALEVASSVGAATLRVFPGGMREVKHSFETAKPVVVQCLRELLPDAELAGVVMALEDHGPPCGTAQQLIDIMQEVDSPWVRLAPDIGNFLAVDENPLQAVKKTAPYAAYAHIKDFIADPEWKWKPCVPGEGIVDLNGCVKALWDAGYREYISLEYEALEDPLTGIPRSLENMKRAIELARR